MVNVRPIRTEADYEAALARVAALMDAREGTPEGEELDVLVDLVEVYEDKHFPMGYPDPVAAIEFCMDQQDPEPSRPGSLHREPRPRLRGALGEAPDHDVHGACPARTPCHSRRGSPAEAGARPTMLRSPALMPIASP